MKPSLSLETRCLLESSLSPPNIEEKQEFAKKSGALWPPEAHSSILRGWTWVYMEGITWNHRFSLLSSRDKDIPRKTLPRRGFPDVYLQVKSVFSAYMLGDARPLCQQLVASSGFAQPRASNWLTCQSLPGCN